MSSFIRSRLFRRVCIYATLLMVIVYFSATYAEPINTRLQTAAAVRACLDLPALAPGVLYSYHPNDGRLVDALRAAGPASLGTDDDGCSLIPHHILPPRGTDDPPAVDLLNQHLNYILTDYSQTLFCHAMTSRDGQRRLVIVDVWPDPWSTVVPQVRLEAFIYDPGSLITAPHIVGHHYWDVPDPTIPWLRTQFYCGRLSTTSDTLLLPYRAANRSGEIRMTLAPDGKAFAAVTAAQ
jgi:hypothetical protein